MASIDEVKDRIIEHLKDAGSASINELVRVTKAGKGTVYSAIDELEKEGIIKTHRHRTRRVVSLRASVPAYLKVYLVFLSLVGVLYLVEVHKPSAILILLNRPGDVVHPSLFAPLLLLVIGYGLGIATLKTDDVVESLAYVKKAFVRMTKSKSRK